jgi:type II secretory ATPase GspE/PulE/Tfp pilus assembly ATPase PilB-like protein
MSDIIELPLPPLSDREHSPILTNTPVTVFFINGRRIDGKLRAFNVEDSTIRIIKGHDREETEILMHDIKAMHLSSPLQWVQDQSLLKSKKGGIKADAGEQEFLITFKDQTKLHGKTYGTRVDKNGLHLFKEHNSNLYLKQYVHIFIPRSSIENNLIGEQIGEILAKDHDIPRDEIEIAVQEQRAARAKPLGEFLIENEVVNEEQLLAALKRQKSMPNLKLGEILVSESLISEDELDDALETQKRNRQKPLGEILVEKGIISRDQIQQALAKKLGIPFVHIQEFPVTPDIIREVPAELAFKHKVVPLVVYEGKLVIAIENPLDWNALDALRFHTGKYIEPVMASAEDINWALQFHFSSDDILNKIDDIDEDIDNDFEAQKYNDSFTFSEDTGVSDNIIVKIANKIILDAHQQGVSDIHIEPNPGKSKVVVRFRKDGSMHVYHTFPPQYRNALISRIKVMARLDISERRKPQDGKISFKKFGPANIELRIATLPTANDLEDVVMRILSSGKNIPVNALGLSINNRDRLIEGISKPYGLFLVCGPTGSGKTTTLHSVLGHLNNSDKKIWTAEDPIEITQPGLRQVQVNPKIGLDFAAAMRAFLRADPDIIMIGEMRDTETAGMGIEASLTGHLVLSTLHTNSAAESIVRLLDMEMDPFNFADALIGILAQRLAKTLCPNCKRSYQPDEQELHHLAHEYCKDLLPPDASEEEQQPYIDNIIEEWRKNFANQRGNFILYKPTGCKECNETGYRGRIGLHELLIATPKIKQMILTRTPAAEIHVEALNAGMRTLKQDGIEKVLQGYLDLPHVRAVCIK